MNAWGEAVGIVAWAGRFYLRHWPWVVGISLIPAAQRFVFVFGQVESATAAGIGEAVTGLARLALLGLVVWLGIVRDPALARMGTGEALAGLVAFVFRRPVTVVVFAGMVVAAVVVFDVVPGIVGGSLPVGTQHVYEAVLLAVKNPTVIAFTLLSMVSFARHALIVRASRT